MTCKCNLCGRENVKFGSIIGVDFANENGGIMESLRSVVCFDCTNKIALKIKEIEDEYN